MSHAGSLSSSGSEFQTVGPATGKARRQYVLSRQRGTISRCRLAERSRCRDATSMAGVIWSARYRGACPCKPRYVMRPSLKVTLSGTSSQCSLSWRSLDRPRSNFFVSLTTRAAALDLLWTWSKLCVFESYTCSKLYDIFTCCGFAVYTFNIHCVQKTSHFIIFYIFAKY